MRIAVVGLLGCLVSCTSLPLLVPNPPASQKKETASAALTPATAKKAEKPAEERPASGDKKTPQNTVDRVEKRPVIEKSKAETRGEVDFSLALSDTQTGTPSSAATIAGQENEGNEAAVSPNPVKPDTMQVQPVAGKKIRVALRQNSTKVTLYSMDTMGIHAPSLSKSPWFRGRMTVSALGLGVVGLEIGNEPAREVALPCTLVALDESNLFNLGQESYRGSVVIAGNGKFSVVDYVDVEDYLRGVLPLEMGVQGKAAAEALKAQAVTARTYAYKRISTHAFEPFDVVATIADQVYGGADIETPEADFAVRSTRDLVVVWHNAIADVYYHSTCGGMTADVSEAWGRPPCEYLSSVSDAGPDGTAWCSGSKYFTWEETWSTDRLSKILRSTVRKQYPGETFSGVLEDITVYSRFGCDRVKTCALKGSDGSAACGGDKVRFVLRRKSAGGDILRSANFTVAKNGPQEFVLKGKGYGHGVGLCQMGAIGRASAGQSFKQILAAYFKNTEIRKVIVEGENR